MRPQILRQFTTGAVILYVLIACYGCGDKGPKPVPVVAQLVEEEHGADSCVFTWAQTDDDGNQVAPGRYRAHMTAGIYNGSVAFEIRAQASSVPSSFGSSFCMSDSGNGTPASPVQYRVSLNDSLYAVGDTVCIIYTLPASVTDLRIQIER